jgi:hypothetical protein
MNHVFYKPALCGLLILAVASVSALLMRGSTGAAPTPALPAVEPVPRDPEPAPSPPAPKEEARPAPAAPPKESQAQSHNQHELLETIGALTAAHCYQTYLNLGFVADSRARGTYTPPDAARLVESILTLLDTVDRKLATLDKLDLERDDRDSLEQMRALTGLLRRQGADLQAFWQSGKEEDGVRYENGRKDAWAAISRLTGLDR